MLTMQRSAWRLAARHRHDSGFQAHQSCFRCQMLALRPQGLGQVAERGVSWQQSLHSVASSLERSTAVVPYLSTLSEQL